MNCIICNCESDTGVELCGKEACELKSRSIYIGNNFVMDTIRDNFEGSSLILKLAKDTFLKEGTTGAISKTGGESTFLTLNDIGKILDDKVKDPEDTLNFISGCYTDDKSFNETDSELYGAIKWILTAGSSELVFDQLIENKTKIFKVHRTETYEEKKLSKENYQYLYHGSSTHRWYSIISNGIKNLSRTSLMACGAVYGNGIYLSDKINIPNQYATGSLKVIGVFKMNVKDVEKSKKATGIYVVDDPKLMVLTNIIVIPLTTTATLYNTIHHKFNQDTIVLSTKSASVSVSSRLNKAFCPRLVKEKKLLEASGFIINIPDDNNPQVWEISVKVKSKSKSNEIMDKDSLLYKSLRKYKISRVKFEFRFPVDYPMAPPFVRIISPIFKFLTGHITRGGAVCLDIIINRNAWSPVFMISTVLHTIFSVINTGDGDLDPSRIGQEYSFDEAKEAFNRLKRTHNWK